MFERIYSAVDKSTAVNPQELALLYIVFAMVSICREKQGL